MITLLSRDKLPLATSTGDVVAANNTYEKFITVLLHYAKLDLTEKREKNKGVQ